MRTFLGIVGLMLLLGSAGAAEAGRLHLYYEEWVLDGGREELASNHAVELHNLKDDVGERRDLANINIKKRDELLNDLLAWRKSVGAPIPSQPNPNYAPAAGAEIRGGADAEPSRADVD